MGFFHVLKALFWDSTEETHTATCLCGEVEIETKGTPIVSMYCHCSQCRRSNSSEYNFLVSFPSFRVNIKKGEDHLKDFAVGWMSHRYFCKKCGTRMFNHLKALGIFFCYPNLFEFAGGKERRDGQVPESWLPQFHAYYSSRLHGMKDFDDGLPHYSTAPLFLLGNGTLHQKNEKEEFLQFPENGQNYLGQCFCGKVKFEFKGDPLRSVKCCCSQCRVAIAQSYAYASIYPKDKLELLEGSELIVDFYHGTKSNRQFCANCGTRLWNIVEELGVITPYPSLMNFGGGLEGGAGYLPESWNATCWVQYGDRLKGIESNDGLVVSNTCKID